MLTHSADRAIHDGAKLLNDDDFLLTVSEVDLIAQKAKYHKQCYAAFMMRTKRTSAEEANEDTKAKEEDEDTIAFQKLLKMIDTEVIVKKHVLDMNHLHNFLSKVSLEKSYTSARLKARLENHYGNRLVFQQIARNKAQLVYSANISLADAIKVATSLHEDASFSLQSAATATTSACTEDEEHRILMHAAMLLRAKIQQSKGISMNSFTQEDISLDKAFDIVPTALYSFFKYVIEGVSDSSLAGDNAESKTSNRHVLSVSQDLIHIVSSGRCKTPKHIGLAMAVKHITGSKLVNAMLNRAGHCISYDDLERIDTAIAKDIVQRSEEFGVVLPSNIKPGNFVHVAADNLDINEETIDGRNTTHATSIVMYQRNPPGSFGDVVLPT